MNKLFKEKIQLICWVCKKPVDKVTRSRDVLSHRITFVAECHGETEEVSLYDSDIVNAKCISLGYAFQPRDSLKSTRTIRYSKEVPTQRVEMTLTPALKEDLCLED